MPSKQLIQKQLPHKLEKLDRVLDWAARHCDQDQLDRFNEKINEYNEFLVGYPFHGGLGIAHKVSFIEPVPRKQDLMGSEHENDFLKTERNRRKAIINKLEKEIHELNEMIEK